jgi:hypothetical protein
VTGTSGFPFRPAFPLSPVIDRHPAAGHFLSQKNAFLLKNGGREP